MRILEALAVVWLVGGLAGCPGGADDDVADDDVGDDDAGDDDTGDDDTGDDDTGDDDTGDDDTAPDPEWSCADGLSVAVSPLPTTVADVLHVDVTGDQGYVHVGLDGTGPGGEPVSGTFDDVVDHSGDGSGPWTWYYVHGGLHEGRYDWSFTADKGQTWLCDVSVWVVADTGDDDTGDDDTGDDDTGDDDTGDDDTGDDDDSVGPPPDNPFGIGLVGPGNTEQWDWTAALAGRGGHVKLIFPGIQLGMTQPPQEWIDAVNGVYARDLVPVIRLQTAWGDTTIRNLSDDPGHMDYHSLAAAFGAVVQALPKRPDWPMVIEVFNEPNLCYEWTCDAGEGWLDYTTMAAEYAALLRDVTDSLHALGDPRIQVINAGYAPGGVVDCECGGIGWNGGITSEDYIAAMEAAVPGVHGQLDGFATHAYPAQGEGWGFFEEYAVCGPGLYYFESELAVLGNPPLRVFVTETGWSVNYAAAGNRQLVADWTLQAWQNDWFPHPNVEAVMPFMLQDGQWEEFAWIDLSGNAYPVFTTIRDWRCSMAFPDPC